MDRERPLERRSVDIGGARLDTVVAGSGHQMPVEVPDVVSSAILGVLDEVAAVRASLLSAR